MTLDASDPEVARQVERLSPYARRSLEESALRAHRIHADELTPEHVLLALLTDEECGATRLVLHAFADPETLAIEVLALCPGTMVVARDRSLPFSARGLRVLEAARRSAAERGEPLVTVDHLFTTATEDIAREEQKSGDERLVGLGWKTAMNEFPVVPADPETPHTPDALGPVSRDGPLFKRFSQDARRALGLSCRQAALLGRAAISPVHLLVGCLEGDEELRGRTDLTGTRVLIAYADHDADDSELPPRSIPPDDRTRALLAALPDRAGTLDILGFILRFSGDELRLLLERQRITKALLERGHGRFGDPEV